MASIMDVGIDKMEELVAACDAKRNLHVLDMRTLQILNQSFELLKEQILRVEYAFDDLWIILTVAGVETTLFPPLIAYKYESGSFTLLDMVSLSEDICMKRLMNDQSSLEVKDIEHDPIKNITYLLTTDGIVCIFKHTNLEAELISVISVSKPGFNVTSIGYLITVDEETFLNRLSDMQTTMVFGHGNGFLSVFQSSTFNQVPPMQIHDGAVLGIKAVERFDEFKVLKTGNRAHNHCKRLYTYGEDQNIKLWSFYACKESDKFTLLLLAVHAANCIPVSLFGFTRKLIYFGESHSEPIILEYMGTKILDRIDKTDRPKVFYTIEIENKILSIIKEMALVGYSKKFVTIHEDFSLRLWDASGHVKRCIFFEHLPRAVSFQRDSHDLVVSYQGRRFMIDVELFGDDDLIEDMFKNKIRICFSDPENFASVQPTRPKIIETSVDINTVQRYVYEPSVYHKSKKLSKLENLSFYENKSQYDDLQRRSKEHYKA
ncbi:hypothetical protein ACOME3_000498 [Neoechinorhynchus agilis]